MRADRFAAVLGVLWAAHDVADHVIQTDHQASTKAAHDHTALLGMGGHLAGQTAAQGLALAGLHAAGVRLTPGRTLAGLALSVATHGFLDRRWPVVELLRRTGSDRFADARISAVLVDRTADAWREERGDDAVGVTRNQALPLHGPYLADQALHHAACVLAAAVIAS